MDGVSSAVAILKENGFCDAAPLCYKGQLAVIGLFPYETQTAALPRESAAAYIDVFARKNYYREMVCRLKAAAVRLREGSGLERNGIRIFVNSPLPEKEMAVAAGLGFCGKSTLLISPSAGANTLIGGLLFSNAAEERLFATAERGALPEASESLRAPARGCGTCRACLEACPVGALSEKGLDRDRCLQSRASRAGRLPAELLSRWDILYGCSRCRNACPYNCFNRPGIVHNRGEIDPTVTLGDWLRMAAAGEDLLSAYLKKTVLAMGWIEKRALIRNVVILCRRLGLFPDEVAKVCSVYKNEFSELSSVDIPSFFEYSGKDGVKKWMHWQLN